VKRIAVFTLLAFLLVSGFAAAQQVSIDVAPQEMKVEPFHLARFIATVSSSETEGGIYLFVTGSPSHWINMGTSYIDLPARKPVDVLVEFYPNDKPGTYYYTFYAQLTESPETAQSQTVKLVVSSGEDIFVKSHSIEKHGRSIDMQLGLLSEKKDGVTVDYSIVNSAGTTVATYTRTYFVEGAENVSQTIELSDDMVADTYTAVIKVKGTDYEFSKSFDIEPVRRIVKSEEEVSGLLYDEHRISISNDGNVVEKGYVVSSNVPTGFLVFSHEPDECSGGKCVWSVEKLNPDEDVNIVYRVEYWPLFAEGLMIAVLLGVFVFFARSRMGTPRITKTITHGKDGYTAVIEIRNPSRKITNVVVRDEVSPLFRLEDAFETLKPAVKHHESSTELVWSLPAIEPGDHRIIHYRLRPVVNGDLKVPKAYMRYATADGKKMRAESRELNLAA